MPAVHPVKFRRKGVALARAKEKRITVIASDLNISESYLRRVLSLADFDTGVSSDERAELVLLRREDRLQAAEIDILKQASAYARETVPKTSPFGSYKPGLRRSLIPC